MYNLIRVYSISISATFPGLLSFFFTNQFIRRNPRNSRGQINSFLLLSSPRRNKRKKTPDQCKMPKKELPNLNAKTGPMYLSSHENSEGKLKTPPYACWPDSRISYPPVIAPQSSETSSFQSKPLALSHC